jgi:two-component system, OmpR family, alkaline phosphatase synthesis response regulator PhoP
MEDAIKGSKILLVEDEETLAVGLEYNLIEEGYLIEWAKNGREAVDLFKLRKFDLIILDIMLPYLNGFEVAEIVRKADPQIPILMLTAKTESGDKIKGLQKGADDYLTKPFHLQELLLRVNGMLKRKLWYKNSSERQPHYTFGNNDINFENLNCKHGKEEIRLTPQEAMLLKYLVERKGEIVSRKELLENVWHLNPQVETRTVDIFIARLRKYFEPDPSNPVYFKSIRSAGYMFEEGN